MAEMRASPVHNTNPCNQLPTKSCLVHRSSVEDHEGTSNNDCTSSSMLTSDATSNANYPLQQSEFKNHPPTISEGSAALDYSHQNNPTPTTTTTTETAGHSHFHLMDLSTCMYPPAPPPPPHSDQPPPPPITTTTSSLPSAMKQPHCSSSHNARSQCDTSGFVSGSSSTTQNNYISNNNGIPASDDNVLDDNDDLYPSPITGAAAPTTILRPRTSVCTTSSSGAANRLSHSRSPPLRRASAGCLYNSRLKECGANEFIPIESGQRNGRSGVGGSGGGVTAAGAVVVEHAIPSCSNSLAGNYERYSVGWEDDSSANSSCSPSHSLASFSLDCDGTDASVRESNTLMTQQRSRSASFQNSRRRSHQLEHSHHHRHLRRHVKDNLAKHHHELESHLRHHPVNVDQLNNASDSIALLVDNRRFVINVNFLRAKPHTMLGRMFSGSLPPTRYRLDTGEYSLNDTVVPGLTADVFTSILEYYTKGRMHCPPHISVQEFKDICDYFMVPFNHRTVHCTNLRAFLHEVSNDGAKEIFERFLDDDLLPEMVKSAKMGERECHIVILLDDDIVDWDHDNPPQIPDNEINSQRKRMTVDDWRHICIAVSFITHRVLYSTQMYRFLKYIENREVAKQVLQERGLKKIRIGIEGYPTQKEKVKMRSGHRKEVIYNFAQRPFLRMSWEEEENRSRHVDFQFVKSKSNNDLTSLSLGEAAEHHAVDLPPSLTPPPVLGAPVEQQTALLESLHPLRQQQQQQLQRPDTLHMMTTAIVGGAAASMQQGGLLLQGPLGSGGPDWSQEYANNAPYEDAEEAAASVNNADATVVARPADDSGGDSATVAATAYTHNST